MLLDQAQGRSRTLYPRRCEGRWRWWWGGLLCIQLSPSISVPLLFYNSCSQTSGEAAPADTRLHKQSSSCVLSPCLTRSECFTGRRLGLGAPALMALTKACSYESHYLASSRLLKLSYLIILMREPPKEAADIQPCNAAAAVAKAENDCCK